MQGENHSSIPEPQTPKLKSKEPRQKLQNFKLLKQNSISAKQRLFQQNKQQRKNLLER
jgi:hypothetical protein